MTTFGKNAASFQSRIENMIRKSLGEKCNDDLESYWEYAKVLDAIKPEHVDMVLKASGISAKNAAKSESKRRDSNIKLKGGRPAPMKRSELLGATQPKKFKRITGVCDDDTRMRKCNRNNCKFLHPWGDEQRALWT